MNGLESQLTVLDNEIGYYRLQNGITADDAYISIGERLEKADTKKDRVSLLKQLNEYAIHIGMKARREPVSTKPKPAKPQINVKKWVFIFRIGIIFIWLLSLGICVYQAETCSCPAAHEGLEGEPCKWVVLAALNIVFGIFGCLTGCLFGGDGLENKLKRVNDKRKRRSYA